MAYLLDTNHAFAFLTGTQSIVERVEQASGSGVRFYLCMPIVGELYFAVYASAQQRRNRAALETLLDKIAVLDFDLAAAEEYGRVRAELKTKGRPIPSTDVQIAAIARLHNLVVLSSDHHFQYVDNLVVESWS